MKKVDILFIIAIISFLVILSIVINIFYSSFGISINLRLNEIDKINNTLLSLSTSYITGYLIYLITVVFPRNKKQKIFNQLIKDNINDFYNNTLLQYVSQTYSLKDDIWKEKLNHFSKCQEDFNLCITNIEQFCERLIKIEQGDVSLKLFKQRKIFLDNIVLFNEYMSDTQHKLIRSIRSSTNIDEIKAYYKGLQKEKNTNLEIFYAIELVSSFSEYLIPIIKLKDTI